jgi:hypothetical protein
MLATPAWLMTGMGRNVPGILAWDGSRLRFADDEQVLVDVSPQEVTEVAWPRLWMGGGFKLRTDTEQFKVTLVKPNGAPDIADELLGEASGVLGAVGTAGEVADALGSFSSVKKGREAGKAWKQVLADWES